MELWIRRRSNVFVSLQCTDYALTFIKEWYDGNTNNEKGELQLSCIIHINRALERQFRVTIWLILVTVVLCAPTFILGQPKMVVKQKTITK